MTKISRAFIVTAMISSVIVILYLLGSAVFGKKSLPILGEPGHVPGQFSFTDQHGKTVTEKLVAGKVTVIEYFFTTCPGICKIMNKNLDSVFQLFRNEKEFAILSHTVDPETDSVPVLLDYSKLFKADNSNWIFLTGDKKELYRMAQQEYLLSAVEDTTHSVEEQFIHTEYVALLDRKRRIRGFYDATNSTDIRKMTDDIRLLISTPD